MANGGGGEGICPWNGGGGDDIWVVNGGGEAKSALTSTGGEGLSRFRLFFENEIVIFKLLKCNGVEKCVLIRI